MTQNRAKCVHKYTDYMRYIDYTMPKRHPHRAEHIYSTACNTAANHQQRPTTANGAPTPNAEEPGLKYPLQALFEPNEFAEALREEEKVEQQRLLEEREAARFRRDMMINYRPRRKSKKLLIAAVVVILIFLMSISALMVLQAFFMTEIRKDMKELNAKAVQEEGAPEASKSKTATNGLLDRPIKAGRNFDESLTRLHIKTTRNCSEVLTTGIRRLTGTSDYILCHKQSIVIQRRFWPFSLQMVQPFDDFKYGFGDLNKEFWLGLQVVHELSQRNRYSLRIEFPGDSQYVHYRRFQVADEKNKYKLNVEDYTGRVGNIFNCPGNLVINRQSFMAKDNYRDGLVSSDVCKRMAGWWVKDCASTRNLNAQKASYNTCREGADHFPKATKILMKLLQY